jgi:long-chain acyl-CoA synthetase
VSGSTTPTVEVLGDDGEVLGPGEVGEIAASGPQVIPGYWNKLQETAHAIPDGRLRTGDVGYIDEQGWVYLVDRRKDLIIASGYKVWPGEVEQVLYEHSAVHEAAVVGVPDSYRGETVKAFVSVKPAATVTPEELISHCRERMAAYKYPRVVEILPELPKNTAGKILRRALRDASAAAGNG